MVITKSPPIGSRRFRSAINGRAGFLKSSRVLKSSRDLISLTISLVNYTNLSGTVFLTEIDKILKFCFRDVYRQTIKHRLNQDKISYPRAVASPVSPEHQALPTASSALPPRSDGIIVVAVTE